MYTIRGEITWEDNFKKHRAFSISRCTFLHQNNRSNISLNAFGVESHVCKGVGLDLLCVSIDISSVFEIKLQTFFGKVMTLLAIDTP